MVRWSLLFLLVEIALSLLLSLVRGVGVCGESVTISATMSLTFGWARTVESSFVSGFDTLGIRVGVPLGLRKWFSAGAMFLEDFTSMLLGVLGGIII